MNPNIKFTTNMKYKTKYVSAQELAETLNCTPNVVDILPQMAYSYSYDYSTTDLITTYIIVYLEY